MRHWNLILRLAGIATVFFLIVQVVGANAYIGAGQDIEVLLGEETQSRITVYNVANERATFQLQLDITMTDGDALAAITDGDGATGTATVEVGARQNRTIPVIYTGASCGTNTCDGTVTLTATSLNTDTRYTDTADITIRRPQALRGAPGITVAQIVTILLAGTFIVFLSRREV